MTTGISSLRIADTPVAVIDFETTGLTPGYDRVVEVSIVRIDPGSKPRVVFDTLVNPARPMAATEIHGRRCREGSTFSRHRRRSGGCNKGLRDRGLQCLLRYQVPQFRAFKRRRRPRSAPFLPDVSANHVGAWLALQT